MSKTLPGGISSEAFDLLSRVIHELDQGVLLQGPKAEIFMCNPAALRMLGVSEAQLLGLTSFDPRWRVVREDGRDFPGPEHPVPTSIATKAPVRDVTMGVYRPVSDDWVWLLVSAVPELTEAGEVRHVVCSFTEITERRRARIELAREHALLRQVMQTSVAGIAVLEPDGQIVFANPAAEQILGLERAEIESRRYDSPTWRSTDLDGGPWPDEAQPFVRVMTTKRAVHNVRHCIEWPNGVRKTLQISGAPVLGPDDEIERLVFSIQDISEPMRAEREKQRIHSQMAQLARQESLAVLAGGVAHDFNNLLVGIQGATELARDELDEDNDVRDSLDLVLATASRASELTQQLLAYSGRGEFVVELLDISEVVRDMRELAGVLTRRIGMGLDLKDRLPAIEVDATQLKQLILNLVVNAADAMGERHGTVRIRTGRCEMSDVELSRVNSGGQPIDPGEFVFAEVEDDGCGMDANTVQRMFDPFFTTKTTGHGLGLAAVLGVLRGHKGFVEVDSRVDEGTRIRVGFPAKHRAPLPRRGSGVPARATKIDGRVLLIDDEDMVRTVSRRILEREGADVITAADGEEGLERFEAEGDGLQAVLIDLTMPRLGGEAVLARIREVAPTLPVLLMSGYTEQRVAADDPHTGFVAKPFRRAQLIAALEALVLSAGDARGPPEA